MKKWCSPALALCLITAFDPLASSSVAAPAAQAPSTVSAAELLKSGNDAYRAGNWIEAESFFARFLAEYGTNPQAAGAVAALKPQLAMARIRLGHFAEALPLIEECLNTVPAAQREELAFWLGICQMQAEKFQEANETFRQFSSRYPASARRNEALLMIGTLLVVQEKNSDAADYFKKILGTLRGLDRGRAVSLLLYALNQSDRLDEALRLVTDESTRTNDILQIAGFQLLALELGSKLLEKGEHRKAIVAFQRVWDRARVLEYQEARLQFLKNRLAALEMQKADLQWTFQLSQALTKIDRELKTFREMKNYDSSLQLRLATAFLGMQRYREAALILEKMLQTMPPDPVVEQAAISLIQCWMAIERWPKVLEACEQFQAKFADSEQLPLTLLLKGQAEQNSTAYTDSLETFDNLVQRFPKSPLAPRAMFLAGYSEALLENFDAALQRFEKLCAEHPEDPMAESAAYWKGIVLSLARSWADAREALQSYQRKYKEGAYLSEAAFHMAYCAHCSRDYAKGVEELKLFLRDYPKSERVAEALLLLGDAYMAEGEIERGIDTYKRLIPTQKPAYEEAWFKIGKALRLQEKFSALRAHMLEFRERNSDSLRIAEALYWIAWSYREENNLDQARAVYWQAIDELGDNPKLFPVEDLFLGLIKLYPDAEQSKTLASELNDLYSRANVANKKTLTGRALWALGTLAGKGDRRNSFFEQAANYIDVHSANPRLLADLAETAFDASKASEAEKLYCELLKWNPRSTYKDKALARLAEIAFLNHQPERATQYFERFAKDAPDSAYTGKVYLAWARLLLAQGEKAEAKMALERTLAHKQSVGQIKAEALLTLGEILMEQAEYGKAIAYFQRVYVMYDRWPTFVAKAYLLSGDAFEKLDDKESALKTYREMVAREELSSLEEGAEAKKRIAKLEPEAAAL